MNKIKFIDYLKEGISNKYELIMIGAQRVQNLKNGSSTILEKGNHKNTVIALTEMEYDILDISELRESLIRELQVKNNDDELKENYILEKDDDLQIDLIDSSIIIGITENQEDREGS